MKTNLLSSTLSRGLVLSLITLTAGSALSQKAQAQEAAPTALPDQVTAEGVVGDVDKGRRSPVLTVRPEITSTGVTIFADVHMINKDFTQYPIQVDYFVNRKLILSQIRSIELPGALGAQISPEIASPPFNYIVVATMLHPNKQYKTVIQGAVEARTLTAVLNCTLTVADSDGSEVFSVYTGNSIPSRQINNASFSITYTGLNEPETAEATLNTTINISGTTASGTLSVTRGAITNNFASTGTAILTNNNLTSVELISDDEEARLTCQG